MVRRAYEAAGSGESGAVPYWMRDRSRDNAANGDVNLDEAADLLRAFELPRVAPALG